MSKREEFVKRKNLEENLKKYNAFSVNGYYPLFSDIETAKTVSPLTSYHIHEFEGVEYYMPEGLEMGVTQFHGDWNTECYKVKESNLKTKSLMPTWTKCWALNHQGITVPWGTGASIALSFNLNNSGFLSFGTGPGSFYQWVVNQIGTINPGDSFMFDMLAAGMCTSPWGSNINKVCIRYDGLTSPPILVSWNGTTATAHSRGCCKIDAPDPCRHFYALPQSSQDICCEKCQGGNINPSDPCAQHCDCCPEPETSWDCVQRGDHPKFGFECVQRNDELGQFTTLQACIDAPCNQQVPQLPSLPSTQPTLTPPLLPTTPQPEADISPPEEPEETIPPPTASRTGGSGGY